MPNQHVPNHFHPTELQPPWPVYQRLEYPFVGYINFQGLHIDVENAEGDYREGTDPNGKAWRCKMHAHYGEIRETEGADGDPLDVYVGPNADSSLVVVVHQQDPDSGTYDEDKVMLGFGTVKEAVECYRNQYNKPGFYQSHTAMPVGTFWRWCHNRDLHGRKIAKAIGVRTQAQWEWWDACTKTARKLCKMYKGSANEWRVSVELYESDIPNPHALPREGFTPLPALSPPEDYQGEKESYEHPEDAVVNEYTSSRWSRIYGGSSSLGKGVGKESKGKSEGGQKEKDVGNQGRRIRSAQEQGNKKSPNHLGSQWKKKYGFGDSASQWGGQFRDFNHESHSDYDNDTASQAVPKLLALRKARVTGQLASSIIDTLLTFARTAIATEDDGSNGDRIDKWLQLPPARRSDTSLVAALRALGNQNARATDRETNEQWLDAAAEVVSRNSGSGRAARRDILTLKSESALDGVSLAKLSFCLQALGYFDVAALDPEVVGLMTDSDMPSASKMSALWEVGNTAPAMRRALSLYETIEDKLKETPAVDDENDPPELTTTLAQWRLWAKNNSANDEHNAFWKAVARVMSSRAGNDPEESGEDTQAPEEMPEEESQPVMKGSSADPDYDTTGNATSHGTSFADIPESDGSGRNEVFANALDYSFDKWGATATLEGLIQSGALSRHARPVPSDPDEPEPEEDGVQMRKGVSAPLISKRDQLRDLFTANGQADSAVKMSLQKGRFGINCLTVKDGLLVASNGYQAITCPVALPSGILDPITTQRVMDTGEAMSRRERTLYSIDHIMDSDKYATRSYSFSGKTFRAAVATFAKVGHLNMRESFHGLDLFDVSAGGIHAQAMRKGLGKDHTRKSLVNVQVLSTLVDIMDMLGDRGDVVVSLGDSGSVECLLAQTSSGAMALSRYIPHDLRMPDEIPSMYTDDGLPKQQTLDLGVCPDCGGGGCVMCNDSGKHMDKGVSKPTIESLFSQKAREEAARARLVNNDTTSIVPANAQPFATIKSLCDRAKRFSVYDDLVNNNPLTQRVHIDTANGRAYATDGDRVAILPVDGAALKEDLIERLGGEDSLPETEIARICGLSSFGYSVHDGMAGEDNEAARLSKSIPLGIYKGSGARTVVSIIKAGESDVYARVFASKYGVEERHAQDALDGFAGRVTLALTTDKEPVRLDRDDGEIHVINRV